ncbi:MAG: hypothetical protein JNK58_00450 [Phycisphaerae bacterium]|nr:hypothetical protein [Phycisphaerae bacterium]
MRQSTRDAKRAETQELMWDAMELMSAGGEKEASRLCRKALDICSD